MKKCIVVFLVFLTLALAACGSSSTPTTSAQPPTPTATTAPTATPTPVPPAGYMRNDSTGVRWLQWTEANGQITGLWNTATLDTANKALFQNGTLTGTHNGSAISLTMGYGGQSIAATGTLQNNTLTLQTPGSNGTMESVTYTGGSLADFNTALTAFKAKYPSA